MADINPIEAVNSANNNNDTDLDQTFNLNASYEIVPAKASLNSSQLIETYDVVDNLVDCNKLEFDADQFETDLLLNESVENVASIHEEANELSDSHEVQEDTEQTVLIPEELNNVKKIEETKSNEIDSKTVETNQCNEIQLKQPVLSEKLKILKISKMPNYFLPQEDMESSMRRLHFNYVDVMFICNKNF